MTCINCNQIIPDDSLFCAYCGAKQESPATEAPSEPVAPETVADVEATVSQPAPEETAPVAPDVVPAPVTASSDSVETPQKPKKSKKKTIIISILAGIMIFYLSGVFIHGYKNYIAATGAMNMYEFSAARICLGNIPFSEKLFSDEYAYVDAGLLVEDGEYADALRAFDALAYSSSITAPDDLYAFTEMMALIDSKDYIGAFQTLLSLEKMDSGMTIPSDFKVDLCEYIYAEGQTYYWDQEYVKASLVFSEIYNYKRSADYITLCKIHVLEGSGSQFTYMNSSFTSLQGLIGFEDVNDMILSKQPWAAEFLMGRWEDGTERNVRYFEIDENWHPSSNLPINKKSNGHSYIMDSIFSIGPNIESSVPCFKFSIIDEDTISVYCYKDGSTHTLYRQ